MRRNQIAGAINASLASFGIELGKPVADSNVRAYNQYHIREPPIATIVDLIQNAPGGERPHDRGLPGAGGHLAGIAHKSCIPVGLTVVAWFVARYGDSLQKIGSCFSEEDDGLRRLQLCVEEPLFATIAPPPLQ